MLKTNIVVLKSRYIGKTTQSILNIWQRYRLTQYNVYFTYVPVSKAEYQHFTKLHNRKKQQSCQDFVDAGYNVVMKNCISLEEYNIMKLWCKNNLAKYTVVCMSALMGIFDEYDSRFCFAYEKDAIAFKLAWA